MPIPMPYFRPHLYENTEALREQKASLERRIAETEHLQGHPKRELIENLFSMLCDVEELGWRSALSWNAAENIMSHIAYIVMSAALGLMIAFMLAGTVMSSVRELHSLAYLWACVGFVLFYLFLWRDSVNRRFHKERVRKIKVLLQENPELLPILKGKVSIPREIANPEGGV